MKIIAIDPGSFGAICVLEGRKKPKLLPLPQDPELLFWTIQKLIIEAKGDIEVFVEAQWARKGQGNAAGTHTMLVNFGKLLECFEAHGIKPRLIAPQIWKKEMKVTKQEGMSYQDGKQISIKEAKRLCPKINLKRTERSKVDCDGMAEAYLLALYGKKVLASGPNKD